MERIKLGIFNKEKTLNKADWTTQCKLRMTVNLVCGITKSAALLAWCSSEISTSYEKQHLNYNTCK